MPTFLFYRRSNGSHLCKCHYEISVFINKRKSFDDLFLDKTAENKIKNALYVALTRSKEKLVILICKEVEKVYDQSSIKDFFTKIMTS